MSLARGRNHPLARTPTRALFAAFAAFALTSCDNPSETLTGPITLALSAGAVDLALGESATLSATVTGSSSGVVWVSADPGIAMVTSTGQVTGVGLGTTTVTARSVQDASVMASATVSVIFARCSSVQPISVGSTVNGTLSTTDCLLFDGTYMDFWSFSLSSTTTVWLAMNSTDVDSYLLLFSGDLTEVFGEDDDSGGSLNSLINVSLPAGSYMAIANTFGSGEVGAYELSLTTTAPAALRIEPADGADKGLEPSSSKVQK